VATGYPSTPDVHFSAMTGCGVWRWRNVPAVPMFDDSVRGSHPEDYLLLHAGHLHLFRHRWAHDRLVADLSRLGYPTM
jgi:hypothetical protein